MNPNANLKARLFDLMDEKETFKRTVERLESIIKEHEETLDEVRGELRIALNTANRRGDMVRELITENRLLKRKVALTKWELTEASIDEITDILKKHIEPKTEPTSVF